MINNMLGSIPHQKLSFFIIYLLEDEQELTLGMLIHLRRIYNFLLFRANILQLSYTYSSSASVAWQSLLLALTSIDGHLHSPLISRVDVRLSPFFVFST